MNVKYKDYSGLIAELHAVRGKDFTPLQIESLLTNLKTIEWGLSCKIINNITRLPQLPNNLFGLVLDKIDAEKYRSDKNLEMRKTWKASENCLDSETFQAGAQCLALISRMDNTQRRFVKFADACTDAIDRNNLLPFLKSTLHLAENYLKRTESKNESFLSELPF